MLITDAVIKRSIPHEPGEWMEFRRLSAKRLHRARKAKEGEQREEAGALIKIIGPEFLDSIQTKDREKRQAMVEELEELEYHISNFDMAILLKEGLVAWSYDDKLPTDYEEDPTELLDERTAVWAAQEIISITRPPTEVEVGEV